MASERNIDVLLHTKMAVPLFAKMKTAMVLHGTERYFYPEFQNFYNELYLKTIYQQYLNKADLIIADAENARKDMVEQAGVDASKVKVAHLAGDEEFHVIEDAEKLEHVKSKYNLPDRFLIFVGHIYPGKNIGRLLGAFAKVRKDEDIALVLVGGMRRKFQDDLSRIEELGLEDCVQLTGYVPLDDLVALYNLAEATVFPSIYECFPAPPLDAGSCGCPVITSNTGGTPESAGDAAEYVDPFDEDDIARGIVKVMTDTAWREELIRRGFENNKRFSWEKTAQNTLDALTALHHA
jgi:glycosyltransferase involved in cell wall biosynthesis